MSGRCTFICVKCVKCLSLVPMQELDGLLVLLAALNVPDLLPDGDEGIYKAVQLSLQKTQSCFEYFTTAPCNTLLTKEIVICGAHP